MTENDVRPPYEENIQALSDHLRTIESIHEQGTAVAENVTDPDLLELANAALATREAAEYKELYRQHQALDHEALAAREQELAEAIEAQVADRAQQRELLGSQTQFLLDSIFANDPEGQAVVLQTRDTKLAAIQAEEDAATAVREQLQEFKAQTEPAQRENWPKPLFNSEATIQELLEKGEATVDPAALAANGVANEVKDRSFAEQNIERTVKLVSDNLERPLTRDLFEKEVFVGQSISDTKSLSAKLTYLLSPKYRDQNTSALPVLEQAGILPQRGKMWAKGEEGGKFGRFQYAYRGIAAAAFDPEKHNAVDTTPKHIIEWEPIDIEGVQLDAGQPEDAPVPTGEIPAPSGEPELVVDISKEAPPADLEEEFHERLPREQRASVYKQIRDKMVEYYLKSEHKYVVLMPEAIAMDLLKPEDIETLRQQAQEHGFSAHRYVRNRIIRMHGLSSRALEEIQGRLKDHGLTLQIGDLATEVPHGRSGTQSVKLRVFRVMKNYALSEKDFDEMDHEVGSITWQMSDEQKGQIAKNAAKAAGSSVATPHVEATTDEPVVVIKPEAQQGTQSIEQRCKDQIESVTAQAMALLSSMYALANTTGPRSRLGVRVDKLSVNGSGQVPTRKLFEQIQSAGVATGTEGSRAVIDMVMMFLIHDPLVKQLIEHENPKTRTWVMDVTDRAIKKVYQQQRHSRG